MVQTPVGANKPKTVPRFTISKLFFSSIYIHLHFRDVWCQASLVIIFGFGDYFLATPDRELCVIAAPNRHSAGHTAHSAPLQTYRYSYSPYAQTRYSDLSVQLHTTHDTPHHTAIHAPLPLRSCLASPLATRIHSKPDQTGSILPRDRASEIDLDVVQCVKRLLLRQLSVLTVPCGHGRHFAKGADGDRLDAAPKHAA